MTKGLSIYLTAIVFAICLMGMAAQASDDVKPECIITEEAAKTKAFWQGVRFNCVTLIDVKIVKTTEPDGSIFEDEIITITYHLHLPK